MIGDISAKNIWNMLPNGAVPCAHMLGQRLESLSRFLGSKTAEMHQIVSPAKNVARQQAARQPQLSMMG